MRTALHSWSFRNRFKADPTFDIFQALEITAELGFTGIEIMAGAAGRPAEHLGSDAPEHLNRVQRRAQSLGITIDSLATYNDFAFVPNEQWRLDNIEYIKTWLRLAGEMGVPNIRMLTGYDVKGEDRKHLEDLTRRGIGQCIPVAEAAGVNMAIENHSTVFLEADEIVGLIRDFGSARLTACPDPSNWAGPQFWEEDCHSDMHGRVLDNAAKLSPFATQSHLKIKGITKDGHLRGFGAGLDRLLQSYHQAGYEGAIEFESILDGDDLLVPLVQARQIVEAAICRVTTPSASLERGIR
jgi:L-ribulose-5-phosphate 3-epimerase UlaE